MNYAQGFCMGFGVPSVVVCGLLISGVCRVGTGTEDPPRVASGDVTAVIESLRDFADSNSGTGVSVNTYLDGTVYINVDTRDGSKIEAHGHGLDGAVAALKRQGISIADRLSRVPGGMNLSSIQPQSTDLEVASFGGRIGTAILDEDALTDMPATTTLGEPAPTAMQAVDDSLLALSQQMDAGFNRLENSVDRLQSVISSMTTLQTVPQSIDPGAVLPPVLQSIDPGAALPPMMPDPGASVVSPTDPGFGMFVPTPDGNWMAFPSAFCFGKNAPNGHAITTCSDPVGCTIHQGKVIPPAVRTGK